MRRRFSALAVASVLLLGLSHATAWGQMNQDDLRAYTEHEVQRGSVRLTPPHFNWERDPLVYLLPDTILVDWDDPKAGGLDVALNAQFTVTAIRRYRDAPAQRRFWTPVLRRVEAEIQEMLRLVEASGLEGDALRTGIDEISDRIARIYQDELDRLAKENGKRGAVTEKRVSYHFVTLATIPGGGIIRYMPAGRWTLYLFMTQQRNRPDYPRPEWTTVRQTDQVPLFGKNWFYISWPDGREHKELVEVTSGSPITFTQPPGPPR